MIHTPHGHALVVDSAYTEQARAEISAFVEENRITPPQPGSPLGSFSSTLALFGYFFILSAISILAGFSVFEIDWYLHGRVDSQAIVAGESWRVATALTLHGSAQHLVANLGFGLFFLHYSARYLGYGLAGLAMLLAGILGNAVNVYLQGPAHFSIGASTAVFGMLGVLCAYVWKKKYVAQLSWPRRLGPLFGGVALLGFTGTHGENTDIGAHLWGFAAGLVIGACIAVARETLPTTPRMQKYYATMAVVIICGAWAIAIFT